MAEHPLLPGQAAAGAALWFAMANAAAEPLLVIDAGSLNVLAVNEAVVGLLGHPRDALVGMPIERIEFTPQDRFYWESVVQGRFSPLVAMDTEVHCADGSVLPVEKTTTLADVGGRACVVVSLRSCRARRELEGDLAEAASQLRATIESVAAGVLVTSVDGVIRNMNHRFGEIWGLPRDVLAKGGDAAVRHWIMQRVCEPDLALQAFKDVCRDRARVGMGALALTDGRHLEWRSKPQLMRGEIVGRVFSFMDVTERVLAQQAMTAARDAAEKAVRAKNEFLAVMTHELRTPLSGIIGIADLLRDSPLDREQRELVASLRLSATALLNVVNDILDHSRIEAGRLELDALPFDPARVLREVMDLLAAQAADKQLGWSSRIAEDVPQWVVGDPGRLRQILINLLGNALKFTVTGSVTAALGIAAREAGRICLEFEIVDSGIGIPAARLPVIFQPFEQGDNSIARRYGGTGLGLAISERIVARMGGEIAAESEEGKGSKFRFTGWFELAEGPPAMAAEESRPPPMLSRKLRVLVVDDSPINLIIALKMLEKLGAEGVPAESADEALAALSTDSYDLVLMDCVMPGMDGYAATREIRSARFPHKVRGLPVIALTAGEPEAERLLAREAGMNDLITKPVPIEVLGEALRRWGNAGPGEVAVSTGAFDEESLKRLMAGDAEIAELAVRSFLAQLPGDLTALQRDAEARNCQSAGARAHAIKGLAGSVGGVLLAHVAGRLEADFRSGSDNSLATLASFLSECERLRVELESFLARGAALRWSTQDAEQSCRNGQMDGGATRTAISKSAQEETR